MEYKYSYIIYKIYSWSVNKKGETPIFNTILTLSAVHFFQLLVIFTIIDGMITPLKWTHNISKLYLCIFSILFYALNYLLLYNKNRWSSYVERYKNESYLDWRKGNFFVLAYLIGSVIIFFILLPIVYS